MKKESIAFYGFTREAFSFLEFVKKFSRERNMATIDDIMIIGSQQCFVGTTGSFEKLFVGPEIFLKEMGPTHQELTFFAHALSRLDTIYIPIVDWDQQLYEKVRVRALTIKEGGHFRFPEVTTLQGAFIKNLLKLDSTHAKKDHLAA